MSDQSARQFMWVNERFGGENQKVFEFRPSVLYALSAPSTPESVIDKAIEKGADTKVSDVKEWKAMEAELGKRQGQRTDLAKTGQPDLIGGLPQNFAEVAGKETLGGLVQNFAQVTGQKTRQVAAEKAGFGNAETYRQAKTVVTQAEPELVATGRHGRGCWRLRTTMLERQLRKICLS